jgi:peptidoglycan hydrolase-like protein with peptidoglycan-binding domain
MKKLIFSILFIGAACLNSVGQPAQTTEPTATYNIQLGVFAPDVKQADFEAIRSYAYVFKKEGLVYIGGFPSEESAEVVLAKVKAKGFDDAFVATRSLKKTNTVYTIQLATKQAGEDVYWKTYAKGGNLFAMPFGTQVRITSGSFEDKNDARIHLKKLQTEGFVDAFVKAVNSGQLVKITEFETGDKAILEPQQQQVVASKGVEDPLKAYSVVPAGVVTKRKSVVKFQEALKEVGTYGGGVDGQFGKGTQAAYARALTSNRRLLNYSKLAEGIEGFDGWEDLRLALVIAQEINPNNELPTVPTDLLKNLPDEALQPSEATTALDWHAKTWKALDKWSVTSQQSDQTYNAFRIAYYRGFVHLEDYFTQKNIKGEAATALAASTMQILIGKNLESVK